MRAVTLKLPEDIYLLLKEYARRHNTTVGDVIGRALIEYLKGEDLRAGGVPYCREYIKVPLGEKIAAE